MHIYKYVYIHIFFLCITSISSANSSRRCCRSSGRTLASTRISSSRRRASAIGGLSKRDVYDTGLTRVHVTSGSRVNPPIMVVVFTFTRVDRNLNSVPFYRRLLSTLAASQG